ncbi:hypothetical protein HBI56_107950 [Parastagonospora nodorum]|uniref:Uncharacterized protein n=1 Tax=Phaeosphaeria nodorum (strain SN15 / ATCC MYA-4574 / FGSC 10173) TaxID=321614 RepID=A0A7U2HYT1_PHANO|nr:hypothetical protein HBH56_040550 [Parastagonospora nodorum]QRC93072.1 hypothetical protein JI435_428820 [Parastagonospora nodorum SN15]KAH3932937.1 hypothetical protein HBH54_068300 [Parastagonospora nodorum]KAH3943422.1 hypothetical protein HBH53_172470 [Parastagonospora nodorum]KAH3961878.1 hypothetical protein HBH52_227660 [Parastagonospora nodorum]
MKTALLIASFAVTFALAAPSQPRNADPQKYDLASVDAARRDAEPQKYDLASVDSE